MKFFLDACMSPHHASGMGGLATGDGHEFEHLTKRFHRDEKDHVWIAALAAENDWIVLSGDPKITKNPTNAKAWSESGLTGFFFAPPWQNTNYWKQSAQLVAWWPLIERQAKKTPAGCGFLMPKKGQELQRIYMR